MNLLHLDLPLVARVDHPAPRLSTNTRHAEADGQGGPAERLQDLDEEWTIEALLETGAAVAGMGTLALGLLVDDRWLVLPLIMSVLLLQQTLQGWCPLLPLLRGLGFRTEREVSHERHLLQQLEEERAGGLCPVWVRTESPSVTGPAAARPGHFSLQEFLLRPAR